MKKKIIAELQALNIPFDPKASAQELKKLLKKHSSNAEESAPGKKLSHIEACLAGVHGKC